MARFLCVFVIAMLAFGGFGAEAKTQKPLTNQDVVNLVGAKVSQDSIILAIRNSNTDFDTSAEGLVALTKAGVPDAIVQAMIGRNAPMPSQSMRAAPATPKIYVGLNPEELVYLDNDRQTIMRYLTPEIRTAARMLGFGGVAQYAVLRSPAATMRISNRQPVFLLAVPNNAQPQSYFTLANFVTRNNETREVLIGGGYMSFSSGVAKDRIVATASEIYFDQSRAPSGFTVYKITPLAPLGAGEYAMILYNSQVHVAGFFASGLDSYFDFGID